MLKVNHNIGELFLRRPLIADALDEAAHTPPRIEFPLKGFHTLRETQFESSDGYAVTWAWIVGGRNDGLRYTIGVARKEAEILAGWERGHRDYVFLRPIPEGLVGALQRLSAEPLPFIGDLPGFQPDGIHADGWFSKSLLAMDIKPASYLGEGAKVWRIREGVYVAFPDGSYRLIPHEEYVRVSSYWGPPNYRQGDLLVWLVPEWDSMCKHMKELSEKEGTEKMTLFDRHHIEALAIEDFALYCESRIGLHVQGPATITHPEHGVLELPEGTYEVKLLPGTSRPFQIGID